MLTILSWIIFVPALFWNVILLCVVWSDLMSSSGRLDWKNKRNIIDLIISLTVLFLPGVYLFGWF